MKATLTFDEEETNILRMSINGPEAHYTIGAIDQQCRDWVKHSDLSDGEVARLELIRDMASDIRFSE